MLADDFKEHLSFLLRQSLPGKKAHSLFAPNGRPIDFSILSDKESYRKSAVAIILYRENNDISFLLIKRPTYDGAHSGQIAFPGGKQELTDFDLEHTARRETLEEIGVLLENHQKLGQLSEVFIPVSKFVIQPYIYWMDSIPEFQLDAREVEYLIPQKINGILEKDAVKYTSISISENHSLDNVPHFYLSNEIVWGATALILGELREILNQNS